MPRRGQVKLPSRSRDEVLADERRLNDLAELMPRDVINKRVMRFLDDNKGIVFEKLGEPNMFADAVSSRFAKAGYAASSSRNVSWTLPKESIEAELGIVARELTRDWVNSVLAAWRYWGRSRGVLYLDENFKPLSTPEVAKAAFDDWNSLRHRAGIALLSTIAVTAEDRDFIMQGFWTRLRDVLYPKRSIELPDRVNLVVRDGRQHMILQR